MNCFGISHLPRQSNRDCFDTVCCSPLASASLQAKLHVSISSSKLCYSFRWKQVLSFLMILNQWSCTWYMVFCIISGTAPVISGNLLLIRNRSSNFKHLGINSRSVLPDKFAIVHAGNAKLSETVEQWLNSCKNGRLMSKHTRSLNIQWCKLVTLIRVGLLCVLPFLCRGYQSSCLSVSTRKVWMSA